MKRFSQTDNKRRRKNQPIVLQDYPKSTSQYNKSWMLDLDFTDPELFVGDTHDDWAKSLTKMIPYKFSEGNKDIAYIEFNKKDHDYINYWLLRIAMEVAHKSHTYPGLFTAYNQIINYKNTHQPLNKTNTALTLTTGLSINWIRDGFNYRFNTKQLPLLEFVFWFAHFWLRRYPDGVSEPEKTVLTLQDVGFDRNTQEKNEDLYPILFVKQNKNDISGRKKS